jgi:hypothetical protein
MRERQTAFKGMFHDRSRDQVGVVLRMPGLTRCVRILAGTLHATRDDDCKPADPRESVVFDPFNEPTLNRRNAGASA